MLDCLINGMRALLGCHLPPGECCFYAHSPQVEKQQSAEAGRDHLGRLVEPKAEFCAFGPGVICCGDCWKKLTRNCSVHYDERLDDGGGAESL